MSLLLLFNATVWGVPGQACPSLTELDAGTLTLSSLSSGSLTLTALETGSLSLDALEHCES